MNGIRILGISHKPALVIAHKPAFGLMIKPALVLMMLISSLAANPTGGSRWIVQTQPGSSLRAESLVQTSPSNPQTPTDTQNKPAQPRPIKRVSPIDTIRRHLQRLGYAIDESKSKPEMIVSSYSDAKRGKVTIAMIYNKRKEVVDFYIYNFGNVHNSADRGALDSYLLSANDAIKIGAFFVDKDGDIGYKYVSAATQLSLGPFEVIYVTMAGVALDRRPEIRKLIETGKLEAAPKDGQN